MEQADTSIHEIETGNLAIPRWVLCPPSSVRVVNWNINRGLQFQRVIEFLGSTKAAIIRLQGSDLNARRARHGNVAREISQKLGLRCSRLDETLDDTRQYVFDESGRFVSVAHIAVMQAKAVAGVENWKQELERTLHQFGGNFGG